MYNSTLFVSCRDNPFILRGRHFDYKVKRYKFVIFIVYLMSYCVHTVPKENDIIFAYLTTELNHEIAKKAMFYRVLNIDKIYKM